MTECDPQPEDAAGTYLQVPISRIFLIGPMGAGKTTIGRHLAAMLGMDFCDSDQEIEARTGAGIPLIFEIEGEPGFRRREEAVIADLVTRPNLVLATGGGVILSEANREVLRQNGTVVYLRAATDILVERTRRDRCRPLLLQSDNPRGKIEELMRIRDPLYRSTAHVVVDTDRRSPAAVARDVIAKLKSEKGNEDAGC
ncbi:MAG: shikimate kinase AroK [Acidiferrobacterales bacterium]